MKKGKAIIKRFLAVFLLLVLCTGSAVAGEYEERLEKANKGDAKAQFDLGVMYAIGQGVPQDYAEAVKWYRKAAEQGNATAQRYLGMMYEFGLGVPQDYVMAYGFYNIAVAKGVDGAKENRDMIMKQMTAEQIAEGQKLSKELFEKYGKK